MEELNELLDYRAAALYTGYTYSTLRHKVSKKEIPFIKMGGKVRFSKIDLKNWITRIIK